MKRWAVIIVPPVVEQTPDGVGLKGEGADNSNLKVAARSRALWQSTCHRGVSHQDLSQSQEYCFEL